MQAPASVVPDAVADVRERIAAAAKFAGTPIDDVSIVAAVKYVDVDVCRALVASGVVDLGENRGAELARKHDAIAAAGESLAARWHYIGRVQSRQIVDIARRVVAIHALTSERAAAKLAHAAREGMVLPQLLVQVNVADDPAKDGLAADQVAAFLDALPDEIRIDGLMTMPAFAHDPEDSRAAFAALRELQSALQASCGERHPLRELSMGTSQDYEIAVREGATRVRLGRILYERAE